jgi:copper oxidase (laccase) domain-containing protein
VLTRESGLACTVMVADCMPILLCDAKGITVAAVHAGWRGLAGVNGNGVLEEVHHLFMPVAPADSAQPAIELIAWIGPCIGPDAFEVGPDVRDAFVATHAQAAACF